jgi:thymidylate kinase
MMKDRAKSSIVIALEGLPGGGKTSLVSFLRQRLSTSVRTVPQIIYSGSRRTWPLEQYYLENDIRKYARAKRFNGKGFSVIMDRSVLSTLAYTAAFDKVNGTNNYPYLAARFSQLVRNSKFGLPDIWIYIKITPTISAARKKRNPRHDHIWDNQKFLREMDHFSKSWLRNFRGQVRFIDGSRSFSKVLFDVKSVIISAINKV